jgi:hypothetical protein
MALFQRGDTPCVEADRGSFTFSSTRPVVCLSTMGHTGLDREVQPHCLRDGE